MLGSTSGLGRKAPAATTGFTPVERWSA